MAAKSVKKKKALKCTDEKNKQTKTSFPKVLKMFSLQKWETLEDLSLKVNKSGIKNKKSSQKSS